MMVFRNKFFALGVAVVLGVLAAAGVIVWYRVSRPLVSSDIRRKTGFPLYVLDTTSAYKVDRRSIKASKQEEDYVFTFEASDGHTVLTFSEQAYPDVIMVNQFLAGLNEYDEFGSGLGNVALTHPKGLKGAQSAVVMPNNTTLVFANPSHDLSKDQWRAVFSDLGMVK